MIHAKTSVADSIWSRVGSSNLNLASLLGNWELDVAILDRAFARAMEELFEQDMEASVEVTLRPSGVRGSRSVERAPVRKEPAHAAHLASAREARRRARRGSRVGRFFGQVARAATVLARALIGERVIGREDAGWIGMITAMLFLMAAAGIFLPRLLAWPAAFVLVMLALASLYHLRESRHARAKSSPKSDHP